MDTLIGFRSIVLISAAISGAVFLLFRLLAPALQYLELMLSRLVYHFLLYLENCHFHCLDLCVLGLGKNGHLGLNEPGKALEPFCHISQLDDQTRQHDMLKTAARPVTHGITLGLKEILNAKEILLLIAGEGKQAAVEKYMTATVTTDIPASFLWLHDNVTCLLDETILVN